MKSEGNMEFRIQTEMSIMDKLNILADAAKYDVSCSSSGSSRRGDGKGIGNTVKAGLCLTPSARADNVHSIP